MPHETKLHGDLRIDPYYWLRERDNPAVLAHLKAENDHTRAQMKPTEALQQQLFEEMKGRIQETDLSVPVLDGTYYYYSRTQEGQQYPIHCRKHGSLEAPEEVLLDENELAKGYEYFDLAAFAPSPDHNLLAFAVDLSGDELHSLRFKNLKTGEYLPDELVQVAGDFEWAEDNRSLFYTKKDAAQRPNRLYRHKLGDSVDADPLVYQEDDESFFLFISKTRSRRFLLLHLSSITSDEFRILRADDPEGTFELMQVRKKNFEYDLDHHGEHFYIVTNYQAKNFRLMKTPQADPGLDNWEEVIPHRPEIKLDSVDMFADYMVLQLREQGMTTLHITALSDQTSHQIQFPELVYTAWLGDNPSFETKRLRLAYSSLVTPRTVYDYHIEEQRLELLKRTPVLGGYDSSAYSTERIHATAEDGTQIPISVVYKKGLVRDGKAPAYLVGYGAYGDPYDPIFSSIRLSLIDRGIVVAIAHVRGGSERGRPWYEAGKLKNKINTFKDFIACAQYLIAEGYTARTGLSISGGSAGGLLIGAVLNMQPDLFSAAVADVPFVDVINTMLDTSIPLTVTEFDEWGNPQKKEDYLTMKVYSPYDNVRAQAFPPLLVTAGLNDPRVQYWEPAKWVAKLRALKTDDNTLLLKINMDAGHAGASGRYDYLKEFAFEYAFVLSQLGIER